MTEIERGLEQLQRACQDLEQSFQPTLSALESALRRFTMSPTVTQMAALASAPRQRPGELPLDYFVGYLQWRQAAGLDECLQPVRCGPAT